MRSEWLVLVPLTSGPGCLGCVFYLTTDGACSDPTNTPCLGGILRPADNLPPEAVAEFVKLRLGVCEDDND